jgi:hypothetical protein
VKTKAKKNAAMVALFQGFSTKVFAERRSEQLG